MTVPDEFIGPVTSGSIDVTHESRNNARFYCVIALLLTLLALAWWIICYVVPRLCQDGRELVMHLTLHN